MLQPVDLGGMTVTLHANCIGRVLPPFHAFSAANTAGAGAEAQRGAAGGAVRRRPGEGGEPADSITVEAHPNVPTALYVQAET